MRTRARAIALAGLTTVLLAACGNGGDASSDGASSSSTSSTSSSSSSPSSSTGNGESDKTGSEVAADAADALEQAGAFRVAGTVNSDGQQFSLDMHLQGQDMTGSLSNGGQTVHLILVGGSMYAQAPADFWASQGVPESFAAQLGSSWVLVPSEASSELNPLSAEALVAELRNPSDSTIDDEVTTGQLDGQPVVRVTESDGSLLQVAAEGTPYPLQIAEKSATDGGELTLSEFGQPQQIVAPPNALDLSQLGG